MQEGYIFHSRTVVITINCVRVAMVASQASVGFKIRRKPGIS